MTYDQFVRWDNISKKLLGQFSEYTPELEKKRDEIEKKLNAKMNEFDETQEEIIYTARGQLKLGGGPMIGVKGKSFKLDKALNVILRDGLQETKDLITYKQQEDEHHFVYSEEENQKVLDELDTEIERLEQAIIEKKINTLEQSQEDMLEMLDTVELQKQETETAQEAEPEREAEQQQTTEAQPELTDEQKIQAMKEQIEQERAKRLKQFETNRKDIGPDMG